MVHHVHDSQSERSVHPASAFRLMSWLPVLVRWRIWQVCGFNIQRLLGWFGAKICNILYKHDWNYNILFVLDYSYVKLMRDKMKNWVLLISEVQIDNKQRWLGHQRSPDLGFDTSFVYTRLIFHVVNWSHRQGCVIHHRHLNIYSVSHSGRHFHLKNKKNILLK